jgi:hypothetical protein
MTYPILMILIRPVRNVGSNCAENALKLWKNSRGLVQARLGLEVKKEMPFASLNHMSIIFMSILTMRKGILLTYLGFPLLTKTLHKIRF